MSEISAIESEVPARLTVRSVLGLASAEDAEWQRLRALQYSRLVEFKRLGLITHLAAAALAALLLFDNVGLIWLGGWLAALVGLIFFGSQDAVTIGRGEKRVLKGSAFWKGIGTNCALMAVWVFGLGFLAPAAPLAEQLGIFIALAALLTGAALIVSAAPLSTILFGLTTSAVMAFLLGNSGHWHLAGCVLMFAVMLAVGTIVSARTYLEARIASSGLAEKSQVVSLLLREFEEHEADWLWEIDTSRRVRSISPRFAFALGNSPEELEGTPFLQLISGPAWESGQFPPSLHDLAEKLKARENFSNVVVEVVIAGEERWWELSGTPLLDDRGNYNGFRGVGSDVTEQRKSSEKIAYLARYDTLTGLPNRLMLNEALGEALRYSSQWRTRCALMMIDLDRFKAVNDSLGHLVGDQLLAQVSKRLKSLMGENELCGRLGGDEFAVVIRDASDKAVVDNVARRIISHLSQPYEVDHHTLYVGASVGSAMGPRDGSNVEELMRNADLALYGAKDEGGGNHCAYEPSLHANAEERRQLEFSLRRALERKEMQLHFQPVVDATSESITNFEALLRWNSKDHGFVSPGKFIPLAEDTRLIVPIGEWVLYEACRTAVEWPAHVRVSVNVSGEQLVEPGFDEVVVRALSESGLQPGRLELEVTESVFLRDPTVAQLALERVIALGCRIALDDFGTGYSSLGYLRQLRFSTIKVDRSFVEGASSQNPESLAIIRAVVAMAGSLNMATTAEGVETEEQLELIRSLGCTKIQGYYFGRPMPASDAMNLLRKVEQTQMRA